MSSRPQVRVDSDGFPSVLIEKDGVAKWCGWAVEDGVPMAHMVNSDATVNPDALDFMLRTLPAVVLSGDDAEELARAVYEEEATRVHALHPDKADTRLRLRLLRGAAGACRDQAPRVIRRLVAARKDTP